MFLGNTLGAASSGLDSIERQLAVVSQNVSNASTPNYVHESVPLTAVDGQAGGPGGVRTGGATRDIDLQLQSNLLTSLGNEAGSNVTQSALAGIDQASGTPGSGQDIASLVGVLQDSFSSLGTDPASSTQQNTVLDKASSLVDGIHSLSDSLVQARQAAQTALSDGVNSANAAALSIGQLSDQIIAAKASGQSTAGLEDDRDGAMNTLAQLTGAKFNHLANGDVQAIAGNSVVPLRGATGPFSVGAGNVDAGTGALPPLMMNGVALPSVGGEMGANITLRDTTIPTMQNKLDTFAQNLAASFNSQNVPLLTDSAGNVPPAVPTGTTVVGFSAVVQVSAGIQAAPWTLNGPTATATTGDNTVVNNVLNTVFSSASGGLPAQATDLVAGFAAQATQAASVATANTSLRTGLESRLSSESGVSVDSELSNMVQLQNAYAANAKVITAVQTMYTALLDSVQ